MTTCVHSSLALTMEVLLECFEWCHVTFASDKLWNGAEKTALPFFLNTENTPQQQRKCVFSPFTPLNNKYLYTRQSNRVSVWFPVVNRNKRGCIGLSSGAFHFYFPQSWLRWHRSTCRCRYNLACCSEQSAIKRHVLLDSVQTHRSLAWRQSVYCC